MLCRVCRLEDLHPRPRSLGAASLAAIASLEGAPYSVDSQGNLLLTTCRNCVISEAVERLVLEFTGLTPLEQAVRLDGLVLELREAFHGFDHRGGVHAR